MDTLKKRFFLIFRTKAPEKWLNFNILVEMVSDLLLFKIWLGMKSFLKKNQITNKEKKLINKKDLERGLFF